MLSALYVIAMGVLARTLEARRPLRRRTQPRVERDARNVALAAIGGAALALAQLPTVLPLTRWVERRRIGLIPLLRLPPVLEIALSVVLLDATLTLWHVLTHRVPLLWRFHEAHHVDLDMDSLTGVRFHFGELLLSVPYRSLQVVLIGVTPRAFSLWQTITTAQILFHHSNARLPVRLERALALLVVTPRVHGIHHSAIRRDTDSNWGAIFSIFDRVAGSFRFDERDASIVIGVPAYREPDAVTLGKVLALPFAPDRREWD